MIGWQYHDISFRDRYALFCHNNGLAMPKSRWCFAQSEWPLLLQCKKKKEKERRKKKESCVCEKRQLGLSGPLNISQASSNRIRGKASHRPVVTFIKREHGHVWNVWLAVELGHMVYSTGWVSNAWPDNEIGEPRLYLLPPLPRQSHPPPKSWWMLVWQKGVNRLVHWSAYTTACNKQPHPCKNLTTKSTIVRSTDAKKQGIHQNKISIVLCSHTLAFVFAHVVIPRCLDHTHMHLMANHTKTWCQCNNLISTPTTIISLPTNLCHVCHVYLTIVQVAVLVAMFCNFSWKHDELPSFCKKETMW